jgi:outer membrane biosynthesis protein TonB
MNDKPLIPGSQPELPSTRPDMQWVMVFTLQMRAGKEEVKQTYKVNKKRLVIGSALSSDIRIQQNSVSNVHAVVEMDDKGNATIFDMASETGVYINDKKIVSQDLKDNDVVKIGFATLGFKKVAVGEAATGAPPEKVRTTGSGRKLFYDAKEDFRPLILEDERNVIQIFDYPDPGQLCLQVVMYWGSSILDVEHVTDNKPVTLGEKRKASFLVPGVQEGFELVAFEGPSANLQLTDGMKGVVRAGNKVMPLDGHETKRLALKKDDIAKIQFKEITFFVSYSPLPPHLRRQRVLERDPLYLQIFFTSIGLTVAAIAGMVVFHPAKPLEPEEVKPPTVAIIFKEVPPPPPPPKEKPKPPVDVKPPPPPPPVKKPPPPPPPVKKPPPPKVEVKPKITPPKLPVQVKTTPHPVTQAANQVKGETAKPAGGNQGAGAKAAGTEGKKGQPDKPPAKVHQNDSRGNPNTKTPTKSQVQGPGNVEAMFSDLGGSISKSMAAGSAGAHQHGADLRGFGNTTTEGNGGLGQIGDGKGGGGDSKNSAGLSDHGFGDGLKGNGLGSIGSGGNLSGSGYGRPTIEVGNASETVIMGGLDKSVIDEYIRRHMPQLRHCYEKELSSAGKLSGRIATRFVISGTGRVSQAGVTSSSIGNPKVESCVLDVLKHIVFPEPLGGGVVEVDYPFSFTPSVGN